MPFSFLAPVFLAGLAALAVPIYVHLTSRPRKDIVRFPSLMFLDRIEYRDASKRRLRDLLLFTLRALALILVAAAFARPYLDRPDAPAVAVEGGRELVVLLDRSASMAVGDRMARARDAVAEVAAGLRRADRATLVVFDHDAAATGRATDQPSVLRAAADTVRAGDGGSRLAPAIRLAESILDGSPLPRRELVIVSDFQRSGWDPEAGVAVPSRTEVRTVAVGGRAPDNVAVVDASFARDRFGGRERVRTSARLVNHGAEAAQVDVELELDGRSQGGVTVTVPAGGGAVARFGAVTLPDGAVRGAVRIGGDGVAYDDALHFTLAADRGPRVRLVGPRGAPRGSGLYLARALSAGAVHDVASLDAADLTAALAAADVVVLNDADPASDDAARRLHAFVEAGGGLVIVMGERLRGRGLEGLLPGRIERTRDRSGAGGVIARIEHQHPVFAAFRGASGGGLTGARFFRYRGLDPAAEATVLARYDDGAPAMVAAEVGRGRVLALTAPLDGIWSDLVLQPAFVPLVHGIVRNAAGTRPAPAWRTVGDLLDVAPLLAADAEAGGAVPAGGAVDGSTPVVLAPGGARLPVRSAGSLVRLEERGFWEIRDPRSAAPAHVVAVNTDPAESDLSVIDPEEVRSALGPRGPVQPLVSGAPADRERRQSLWWYVLVAAFLVMVAETLLGNTLSRRARPPVTGGGEA